MKGGGTASAIVRAYNGHLGAEPLARPRDRTPGQIVRSEAPLKLKAFWQSCA